MNDAGALYSHNNSEDSSEKENDVQDVQVHCLVEICNKQEAQLMLTTGSTRLAVSRQQTWYHSTCYI